jgi:hypothetical protein
MLPLAREEAVWLGLSRCHNSIPVLLFAAVSTFEQGTVNVMSGRDWSEDSVSHIIVQNTSAIDGIYHSKGTVWALTRCAPRLESPSCEAIHLIIAPPRRERAIKLSDPLLAIGASKTKSRTSLDPTIPPDQAHLWTLERCAQVSIKFVDYSTFAEATGTPPPPPLDLAAGYGGWRLP